MNGVISFTGGATLPVGARCSRLTALPALRRPQERPPAARPPGRRSSSASIALGASGMLVPNLVPPSPRPAARAAVSALLIGLALFASSRLRALKTYLLTRRAADLVVVVGIAWLASALPPGDAAELHASSAGGSATCFELLGIVVVGGAGRARPAARGRSRGRSSATSAARSSSQAEEAFLGSHVRALTLSPRRQGRVHRGAHAPRRAARRPGRRGARPRRRPPARARDGALVHDIGKLSVPDAILQKPGPLTDEEFEVIKRHPEWGDRLLVELGFDEDVRHLVREPSRAARRLRLSARPRGGRARLDTRILAVCDVYDALISPRVYRDAWAHERAVELLQRGERHRLRRPMRRGARARPRCASAPAGAVAV